MKASGIKIIAKSFRLFDFHYFDEQYDGKDPSSSESDTTSVSSTESKKPKLPKDFATFTIQMFGINELGQTCSLFVTNYQPFFYVKVGDNWDDSDAFTLLLNLRKIVGKQSSMHAKSILAAELVLYNKLYGFTAGQKSRFVKLTFQNITTMNKTKNLWYTYNRKTDAREYTPLKYNDQILERYESNLPPILRYFHINNISPSGWVKFRLNQVTHVVLPEEKTTSCTFEYKMKSQHLEPLPLKETRVPYKICSFDIEASSSHGDFPIPIKTYKRLAANMYDMYNRLHTASKLTNERTLYLVRDIILAAFGYHEYNNIDRVYPKDPSTITKKLIESLIQKVIVYDIANDSSEEQAQRKKLNTIASIFESVSASLASSGVLGQNGDENEDGDGDEDGNEKEQRVSGECEVGEEDEYFEGVKPKRKNKPHIPDPTPVTSPTSFTDIFKSDKLSRDEKITIINSALTVILPPLEGDKVTFIGSTFLNYGELEPYKNHCIVLNTCADVEGVEIVTTDTERELLVKWTELINKENPDIIIGYNIFGFDYEFMFRRAQENTCDTQFLRLSRKVNEVCTNKNRVTRERELTNTKIVLATGEYDLRYPTLAGRIQIDLYTYFRRDFNLASYKLDDVAGQFISDDIKHIVATTHDSGTTSQVLLYTKNIMGLHAGDYIHIELCGFTSDYYKRGTKFQVQEIKNEVEHEGTLYNVISVTIEEYSEITVNCKWCMTKDDVSPQEIFKLTQGSAEDRARIAKYCIQDCNLVHHLFNKIDVLTGYIEMARICSVPISFLIFRGQGIKLTSFVAKKCLEKDTLMPDLEKSVFDVDGYEGAIVLPPKCDIYMDNPVACVDYASLYPSSMISQNYSPDSKVWTKEYDLAGILIKVTGERDNQNRFVYDNLPGYEYIDTEFDTFEYKRKNVKAKATKCKKGRKVVRWAQLPDNQRSILPAILEELLKARASTRKLIKTESDPFMQNILDKRQLGYKVTANSLYGQCGAKTSTFYEKDVAASTTATGRLMIIYAKTQIEEVYGDCEYVTSKHGVVKCSAEYIYGDTDSVFFTFNLTDPSNDYIPIRGKKALEITIEIAQDVAKTCTSLLQAPMELSYEKTLMPFILLSKKRYVGMVYENQPTKGKLKYMGLSLKRRDSCDYLKDVYGSILNILMDETQTIFAAQEYLKMALHELIEGRVSMEKLIITKAIRGYYKNPKQIAHSVLAERIGERDPGNKPKPGDRMKFVHIVNANRRALQGEKIETPTFIIDNNLSIDYAFYITNQLMKPLQQLFGLAVLQIFNKKTVSVKGLQHVREIAALKKEFTDPEVYMKKREKLCSGKIKQLLFDEYLIAIENKRNGIQLISTFFK